MNVYFSISYTAIKEYETEYKNVLRELKRQKITITETFHENYLFKGPLTQGPKNNLRGEDKYQFKHDSVMRKAISKCDAVIIEASYPSFRLGFEANFALSQQKPVLVLSKTLDYPLFMNHPNLFGAKYTDATLSDEITKFLKHVKEYKLRSRFNLFISEKHKEYLEKEAKHFGISMSDYIRKLIENDMNKK